MKAHLKMHQAPPRTFSCRKCTYSAMRLNALKSHELLHKGIQPTHIREEEERKQIKIKLLEFEVKNMFFFNNLLNYFIKKRLKK